jgi:hypothetical protein
LNADDCHTWQCGVRRIDILFEIERSINGKTPEQRLAVRRERSRPLIAELEIWWPAHSRCHQFVTRIPKASAISSPP